MLVQHKATQGLAGASQRAKLRCMFARSWAAGVRGTWARVIDWHRGMMKSFFAPQAEMNQTDAQRLMFSWKKTELENIFGDEIAETTTHSVSLHDIVCGPDANTNSMYVGHF
jgi:hypothetical protein